MRKFSALVAALCLVSQASAQDVATGGAIFERYCAVCHGLDATGTGPMAPILLVQPSDLTTLTERNGGDFPIVRVVMRIDGREPLVSHGSDMPVFGDFFDGVQNVAIKTQAGQPVLVSQPVADLVAYLRALQR